MIATYQLIPGIITKQNGALSGTPPAGDPATITYDAQGFIDLITMRPVSVSVQAYLPTRRVSQGAHVIPAQAGDPCWFTVVNNGVLHLFVNEGIPHIEACP